MMVSVELFHFVFYFFLSLLLIVTGLNSGAVMIKLITDQGSIPWVDTVSCSVHFSVVQTHLKLPVLPVVSPGRLRGEPG